MDHRPRTMMNRSLWICIHYANFWLISPTWSRIIFFFKKNGGFFEKKKCEKPLSTPFRHECEGKFMGSTMIMHKHDIGWRLRHFAFFVQNENDAHLRCFFCVALLWPFICHLFTIWTVRGKQHSHFGGSVWMNSSKRVLRNDNTRPVSTYKKVV